MNVSTTSTATAAQWVSFTFGSSGPPESPPAAACVPAPEPPPRGPLRWDAVRLDQQSPALEAS
jgi:hypothetical protein